MYINITHILNPNAVTRHSRLTLKSLLQGNITQIYVRPGKINILNPVSAVGQYQWYRWRERRDATQQTLNTSSRCSEGRRALAALLIPADALLARGGDEAFVRDCNKPDASLPARQTERTAFRRIYRSCCRYCSPPWWTAHSSAVRTPNGHTRGWPRTLLTEITALLE